jgi:hypothetical protein
MILARKVLAVLAVVLLTSCVPPPAVDNYGIVVYVNGVVLRPYQSVVCGDGEQRCQVLIRFTFTEKEGSRAAPKVYIVGDGFFMLNHKRHRNDIHSMYSLSPNMTYEGIAKMKSRGRMTILFVWESTEMHKTHLIHVDNY